MEIAVDQDYVFSLKKYALGLAVIPASCAAVIRDNGGTVVSSGAGSVAADGTMSYTFQDSENVTMARNFVIKWTFDGDIEEQLFDVVRQPITCPISDKDLFIYLPEMKQRIFSRSGTSTDTGTTTTLEDASLVNYEQDYTGGHIEIIQNELLYSARIVDYAAGVVTFSPALPALVATGTNYIIRESYDELIETAFEDYVIPNIRAKVGIAAGYIDSKVVKNITTFKAIEIFCRSLREVAGDKWDSLAIDMAKDYANGLSAISAPYDYNDDGNISDVEDIDRPKYSSWRLVR